MTRIVHFLEKDKIMEKNKLEQIIKQKIHWYKYLQIKHLLESPQITETRKRKMTPFENLLHESKEQDSGLIIKIYRILNRIDEEDKTLYQKQWIRDLNIDLVDEDWETIWTAPSQISKTFTVKWQVFKLLVKWQTPPSRRHRINS
ncbi:UNVERIFIED_CONTAM: hypothetical protein K2H54_003839 [Gekko kuhli]